MRSQAQATTAARGESKRLTLLIVLISLIVSAPVQAARAPRAPRSIDAVRVGPGVIGVEWDTRRVKADGFIVYRALKRKGPYKTVARRPADRPYYLDAAVKPDTLYFYKVSAVSGKRASSRTGPTCAWDSDQIVPNGSFELDRPGPIEVPNCPLWWSRRAYNARTPLYVRRDGPEGEQCVEIQAANNSVSGGLRSMLIPMIEGEIWYEEAWARHLPGARPLIGYCCFAENRKPVRGEGIPGFKKPYDYVQAGPPEPDGWARYSGKFTALPGTCYVQIWLIGFRARNTFWLDGAKMVDLTAKRVREFDLASVKTAAAELFGSRSAEAQMLTQPLRKLEQEIDTVRARVKSEIARLSPLEYRRLLVELDRKQTQYDEQVWKAKTMALLID